MTAEPIPGFPNLTIERDLPAVMRDGVTLRADVYRPKSSADLPVLLMRLPYDKRTAASTFGQAHPTWYAEQGYAVVIQDTRGRGTSEGEFYPYRDEAADGHDTVLWAGGLPYTTGRIGMLGFSYVAATQLLAAVGRPAGLATIAPGFTASQCYDGWTYRGGAFSLAFICYWATLLGLETALRAGDMDGFNELGQALGAAPDWFHFMPVNQYPPLQGPHTRYFADWVAHPTYDDYWRQWSMDEDYSRVDVPALHLGGWYDVFLGGTVRNFNGLRDGAGSESARQSQKLLLGPWAHMPWSPIGSHDGAAPTSIDVDDWQVRWFDQMLKGEDRGVLDDPVTVHLLDGGWRGFDGWPPSGVVAEEWFIHSGGRANSKFGDGSLSREAPGDEPSDVFIYDPALPTPSMGGHSCCFDSITPMGRADQHGAEVSRMMLVYTSEPLVDDVTLVGDVSVVVWAATTAVDTDFAARLCVVDGAGTSTNLQEGIIRGRFRESLETEELLAPGEVYEFTLELGPVGARVTAGSRFRLDISSSDFPQWDRNLNTGGPLLGEPASAAQLATQTVLHNGAHPSRVMLPVLRS